MNEETRSIFNERWEFYTCIGPARQAIKFYEEQLQACRNAVKCWNLIGARLGVVKDVRKIIAKLIWDTRGLALFKIVV